MTVYDTVIIRALDVIQLQKLNPLPRGGGGGEEYRYSIFRSIEVENGSRYNRRKSEKGLMCVNI